MKRFISSILILFLFSNCGPGQEKIERIMEDGVEVVVNYLEPYEIGVKPIALSLEKEFTIDTERDAIAELGLVDIGKYFDVDSEGNVYLVSPEGERNTIFKFDRKGNFVTSLGHRGQGPGESG